MLPLYILHRSEYENMLSHVLFDLRNRSVIFCIEDTDKCIEQKIEAGVWSATIQEKDGSIYNMRAYKAGLYMTQQFQNNTPKCCCAIL